MYQQTATVIYLVLSRLQGRVRRLQFIEDLLSALVPSTLLLKRMGLIKQLTSSLATTRLIAQLVKNNLTSLLVLVSCPKDAIKDWIWACRIAVALALVVHLRLQSDTEPLECLKLIVMSRTKIWTWPTYSYQLKTFAPRARMLRGLNRLPRSSSTAKIKLLQRLKSYHLLRLV